MRSHQNSIQQEKCSFAFLRCVENSGNTFSGLERKYVNEKKKKKKKETMKKFKKVVNRDNYYSR